MGKRLLLLGAVAVVIGCDPITFLLADRLFGGDKTENFVLRNEPNDFYRKADHHDYDETETYTWTNCGTQAVVDCEVRPSCPNHWNIKIWDAVGTQVFDRTFHAPHCWNFQRKDWDPMPTAVGVPGDWRIDIAFDVAGVRDCEISIRRLGDGPVAWTEGVQNEHPWVQWTAHCASDRDVDDSHPLVTTFEKARTTIAWKGFTAGTMTVTVRDAYGAVAYHTTVGPTSTSPAGGLSAGGPAGTWTVHVLAQGLTVEEMTVHVIGE